MGTITLLPISPTDSANFTQHDQLTKDIRHVPDAPPQLQSQSRRSSTFGISTPRRTSRSGHSQSQGQSTPPTSLTRSPSEPYLAICPPKLSSRDVSSKLRAQQQKPRRQHTPIPEEAPSADQQTYWNEYDHPDSEFGGDDGGYVIYIDPDASMFPGQKTLSAWYSSVRRLFPGGKGARAEGGDIERQNSSDTLAETGTAHSNSVSIDNSNSDSEDDEVSPAQSRKPLLSSRGNPYGAIARTSSRSTSAATPSRWARYTHPTTSSLCLAAAVVILGIVSIMLATARRKARQTVEVGVLVGVLAALGFVGLAVGGMLRRGHGGQMRGGGGGGEGKTGLVLKVLLKWMVAVAVCVWAGWLGAEVLL